MSETESKQKSKRRPWGEDEAEMTRLWVAGASMEDIATALGRPLGSVQSQATRMKLVRDKVNPATRAMIGDLHRVGWVSTRIALKVGVAPVSVDAILRRAGLEPNTRMKPGGVREKPAALAPGIVNRSGRHWMSSEDTLLRQLVDAGLSDEICATRLKRDVASVERRRTTLRLVRPARPAALPDDIMDRIAEMRRRGLTGGVIARLTKLPVHRVAAATNRLRKQGVL